MFWIMNEIITVWQILCFKNGSENQLITLRITVGMEMGDSPVNSERDLTFEGLLTQIRGSCTRFLSGVCLANPTHLYRYFERRWNHQQKIVGSQSIWRPGKKLPQFGVKTEFQYWHSFLSSSAYLVYPLIHWHQNASLFYPINSALSPSFTARCFFFVFFHLWVKGITWAQCTQGEPLPVY